MSSHDLSVQYDEKEKKYKTLLDAHYVVEQEILHLRKEIIDLQARKQALEIDKSKAAHLVKQCKVDMDLLKSAFFQARQAGL
jgi:hypothetical protein